MSVKRKPTHPGVFLREEILKPNKLGVNEAARRLGVSKMSFSLFISGKRRCTANLARRLSDGTGTSIELWLEMQHKLDKYLAKKIKVEGAIKPLL